MTFSKNRQDCQMLSLLCFQPLFLPTAFAPRQKPSTNTPRVFVGVPISRITVFSPHATTAPNLFFFSCLLPPRPDPDSFPPKLTVLLSYPYPIASERMGGGLGLRGGIGDLKGRDRAVCNLLYLARENLASAAAAAAASDGGIGEGGGANDVRAGTREVPGTVGLGFRGRNDVADGVNKNTMDVQKFL